MTFVAIGFLSKPNFLLRRPVWDMISNNYIPLDVELARGQMVEKEENVKGNGMVLRKTLC